DLEESGSHLLFHHYDPFRHIPQPGPSPLAPFPQYDPGVPTFRPKPPPASQPTYHLKQSPASRPTYHPKPPTASKYPSTVEIIKENCTKNITSKKNNKEDNNKESKDEIYLMKKEIDKDIFSKEYIKHLDNVKKLKEMWKQNIMDKSKESFGVKFIKKYKKDIENIKTEVGNMDKHRSNMESEKEIMRKQSFPIKSRLNVYTKKTNIVPKPSPTIKPKGINYNLFPHPLAMDNNVKSKMTDITVTIDRPKLPTFSSDEDEIMQKMVLMVKVSPKDEYLSSTTASPIIVTPSGRDISSSSSPILRMPYPSPILKKKNGKSFSSPKYLSAKKDYHHDPLYSMHGPPYDHYRIPQHNIGSSFPTAAAPVTPSSAVVPSHDRVNHHLYHVNHLGGGISLSGHIDPYYPPYFQSGRPEYSNGGLLPYFSEEPFTPMPPPGPAPTPLPTLLPLPPLPPKLPKTLPIPKSPPLLPSPPPKTLSPLPSPHKSSYEPYFEPYDNVPERPRYKLSKKLRPLTKPYRKYFEKKKKKLGKEYNPMEQHHWAPTHYRDEDKNGGGATEGTAGMDYPAYSRIPYTTFSCKTGYPAGIYADVDAGCQVWHICEADGRQHSFLCPNGTIFNQQLLTCDWWYNVHCEYSLNFLDKSPSLDVFKPSHNDFKSNRNKKFGNKNSEKSIIKIPTLPPRILKSTPTPHPSPPFQQPNHPIHHPISGPPVHHHSPKSPTPLPSRPQPRPHLIEFESYLQDSYPMYHLNNR
ncbi:unnamed protein product, partial [Meganyctiphanes norvegica]